MDGPKVIVAGAGPAGLAAALRLQERGFSVRVLEASDRAGSKLRSLRRDGFLLDTGAIFLPTTYQRLLTIADDLGLRDDVVPGGFVFGLADERRIHELDGAHLLRAFAGTRAISARDKLRLLRLGPEMVRCARTRFERITQAGRYDDGSLASWSRARFPATLHEQVINPITRGIFAGDAEDLSRVELLGILNLFRGARLVALRKGMGQLADVWASHLDIELGSEVVEVRQTADGATVTWRDADAEHTEDVAGCVVALPAQATALVREDLDPWRRRYLAAVRQGRLITPNIALDRAPSSLGASYTLVPRPLSAHLGGFGCDHLKAPCRAPAGKGLLTLTLTNAWCEQHHDDDDDTLARLAVETIDPLLPGVADDVRFVQITRWTQQYAPVGHYRQLGEFYARSGEEDHTVQLAGEYLASPNLNAAVASGERAARKLLRTLLLRGRDRTPRNGTQAASRLF